MKRYFIDSLNCLGLALLIYLLVNLGIFLYELTTIDSEITSVAFKMGAFYINKEQVCYNFNESLGFILLLFIGIIYDKYRKNIKFNL